MLSSKNILQETLQKRGINCTYDTVRVGGADHAPRWQANLTIPGINTVFTSDFFSKKTEAELDVAKKALAFVQQDLQEKKTPRIGDFWQRVKTPLTSHKVVLLDIENFPQAINAYLKVDDDTVVLAFFGHLSPFVDKDLPFYTFVVKSGVRDAADVAINFVAGQLSLLPTVSKISIVSRDHFGEVLAMLLQECGITAEHVTKI